MDRIPEHVAIIMDGNGRWARLRGFVRVRGHRIAVANVREIVETCARLGVRSLVLYSFSSENWRRPAREVNYLMRLLERYAVEERPTLMKNNVRFGVMGRISDLPERVHRVLRETTALTCENSGLRLYLALSYGGRNEILDAVRSLVAAARKGAWNSDALNESVFRSFLYVPDLPDPDLLIRTGGDLRVSNFLLWQIAYTELWVTPVYWPDFHKEHLLEAFQAYSGRERRYGRLDEEDGPARKLAPTDERDGMGA